ncbi:hypothetical protein JCM33374_g6208 [Metschnikowia sp. JCM 33374]|nr:hypothetical protein JCM33374_g6208 [Metschnikowia sp. JCM 33374]
MLISMNPLLSSASHVVIPLLLMSKAFAFVVVQPGAINTEIDHTIVGDLSKREDVLSDKSMTFNGDTLTDKNAVSHQGTAPELEELSDFEYIIGTVQAPSKLDENGNVIPQNDPHPFDSAANKQDFQPGELQIQAASAHSCLGEHIQNPQTSMFVVKSEINEGLGMGVSDLLVRAERLPSPHKRLGRSLCILARKLFETSPRVMRASYLLDVAYGHLFHNEEKVKGSAAAAFGTILSSGQVSVSVLGKAGVTLYREGKLFYQTQIKFHPEGEPHSVKSVLSYSFWRGITQTAVFDKFTDKLNYEWKTQPGDYLVFGSGDVVKYTSPSDFPNLVKENPFDSLSVLADKLATKVMENSMSKKQEALREKSASLLGCFGCARKLDEEFPTDVSVVVVKVTQRPR